MNEDPYHDLLPAYTLGVLDPAEQAEAAEHVDICPDCKSEAERIAVALHMSFGRAVAQRTPSTLVRTLFLARLAEEMVPIPPETVPVRAAPPAPLLIQNSPSPAALPPPTARPLLMQRWVMSVSAVAAMLALVFGVGFISMKQQFDDQNNHLLSSAFAAPHVAVALSGPAQQFGMTGEVIVPMHGTSGLLIVSGMSHMTANRSAMCWLHINGHWVSYGALHPDRSGIAMLPIGQSMDLHHADQVAITMEGTARNGVPAAGSMLLGTQLTGQV